MAVGEDSAREDQAPGAAPAPDLSDALHALGKDGRAGLKAAGLEPVEVKEKRGWVCIICEKKEA